MRRHKVRYASAQSVHAGYLPVTPGNGCRNDIGFSQNRRWLTEYEIMEYSADKVMQFNDCNHLRLKGLPKSVSSYDSHSKEQNNGSWVTTYGHNIDSSFLEAILPHFPGLDPQKFPFGIGRQDFTKGIDLEPRLECPVTLFVYDNIDKLVDLDKVASSGLELFRRKVAKFDDLSIANFLIELRELRHIGKRLKELSEKQHWSWLSRSQLPAKRQLAFNIADSHLSIKFGVVPLVNDIFTMLRAMLNLRKRVKYLLAQLHRMNTITASIKQYKVSDSGWIDNIYSNFVDLLCDGMTDYRAVPGVLHCRHSEFTPQVGMKYSLFCEKLSEMNLHLRVFLEAFGIKWDPVIVWNAIPFSFLLDWIFDVAGWLGKLDQLSFLPVKLRVHDFYIQWKYDLSFLAATSACSFEHPIDLAGTSTPRPGRFNLTGDRFCRVRFMPDYKHLRLAKWDQNVINKTLLGASLVTTKVAYDRRPVRITSRFGPSRRTLKQIARAYDMHNWLNMGRDAHREGQRSARERRKAERKRILPNK